MDNDIIGAIHRGINFLHNQSLMTELLNREKPPKRIRFSKGEFPAFEWHDKEKTNPHNPFNCKFQQMFILHSLKDVHLSVRNPDSLKKLENIKKQTTKYIIESKIDDINRHHPNGGKIWDFYGTDSGMYIMNKKSAPDMDDTTNALAVLYENGVDVDHFYPNHNSTLYLLKFLTDNRIVWSNSHLFWTFIHRVMPGLNDIDSVVNANCYWFYHLKNQTHMVSDIPGFLQKALTLLIKTDGAQCGSLLYYQFCPYAFVYSAARAYGAGARVFSKSQSKKLIDFLLYSSTMGQKKEGNWVAHPLNKGSHDSGCFETAVTVSAIMNLLKGAKIRIHSFKYLNILRAVDKGVMYLVKQVDKHTGDNANDPAAWPYGAFFLNPTGQEGKSFWYMGSDSLTTALCLEALSHYLLLKKIIKVK